MKMSNKVYDMLKILITIVIPAVATCFNGLALVWKWDLPIEAIDATVTLILTCLGVCLGISSANYKASKSE